MLRGSSELKFHCSLTMDLSYSSPVMQNGTCPVYKIMFYATGAEPRCPSELELAGNGESVIYGNVSI